MELDISTVDAKSSTAENPHSNSLPYIHSLSDDLLLEIFTIYVRDSQLVADYYALPQYILATVCRGWRNLVLNAPLLWTTIQLPLESQHNVATYFERSKPAAIDVSYDRNSQWINLESGPLPKILDAISSHISRIRSLKIKTWASQEVSPILCAWKGQQASQLQTLVISSTYNSSSPDHSNSTHTPDLFGDMRNLQSLILEKFSFQGFLPLPCLTFLRVDRLNTRMEDLQNLLDSCPLLETLIIRQFEMTLPFAENSGRKIIAPSLRSLAVNFDDSHLADCGCFLPLLSAPNLEYLEVAHLWNYMTTHHDSLFSQMTQSPKLRTLHIHSDSIWERDMSFLSSLSAATDLHIHSIALPATLTALSYIFVSTNLKSVTLNLNYESFHHFFNYPSNLPNPRFPFFLRSPTETSDLQVFQAQLQERLGSMANVIPPSTDNGFFADYLRRLLFDEDILWGGEDDDSDEFYSDGYPEDAEFEDHYLHYGDDFDIDTDEDWGGEFD